MHACRLSWERRGIVLCFHDVLKVMVHNLLTVMNHDVLVRSESNVLVEAKVQKVSFRRV